MSADLRLMLADDEDAFAHIFKRWAGEAGHRCDCVGNGDDCLRMLRQHRYDVLFLDLIMPGATAETILTEAAHKYPGMQIVIVSSADDDAVVSHLLHMGSAAYLRKPFRYEALRDLLNELAARHGPAA